MADPDSKIIIIKLLAESDTLGEASSEVDKILDDLMGINKESTKWDKKVQKIESGFKNIGRSVDHLSAGFNKATGLLGKIGSMVGAGGSISLGADALIKYNKSLLGLTAQFAKYGVGATKVEASIVKLGKELNLTREESIGLMKSLEKGLPLPSLKSAHKILANVRKAVGSNADAMKEMLVHVMGLVNEYPSLQKSAENMNRSDKERLKSLMLVEQRMGRISLEQAKGISDYLSLNEQALEKDKERVEEMQNSINVQQEMKKVFEEISLTIGKAILPWLQKISKYLTNNMDTVKKIAMFFGKWVAPVLLLRSLLGTVSGILFNAGKAVGALAKSLSGMSANLGGALGGVGGLIGTVGKAAGPAAIGGYLGGQLGEKVNKKYGGGVGRMAGAAAAGGAAAGPVGAAVGIAGAAAYESYDTYKYINELKEKSAKQDKASTAALSKMVDMNVKMGISTERLGYFQKQRAKLRDWAIASGKHETSEFQRQEKYLNEQIRLEKKRSEVLRKTYTEKQRAQADAVAGAEKLREKEKNIVIALNLQKKLYESISNLREKTVAESDSLFGKLTDIGGSYAEETRALELILEKQKSYTQEKEKAKKMSRDAAGDEKKAGVGLKDIDDKIQLRIDVHDEDFNRVTSEIDEKVKKIDLMKKGLKELSSRAPDERVGLTTAGKANKNLAEDIAKEEKNLKTLKMEKYGIETSAIKNITELEEERSSKEKSYANSQNRAAAAKKVFNKAAIDAETAALKIVEEMTVLTQARAEAQSVLASSSVAYLNVLIDVSKQAGITEKSIAKIKAASADANKEVEKSAKYWEENSDQLAIALKMVQGRKSSGNTEEDKTKLIAQYEKILSLEDSGLTKAEIKIAATKRANQDGAIQEKRLRGGLLDSQSKMLEASKQKLAIAITENNMFDTRIKKQQTEVALSKQSVDIMENFMMGIGPSIEMRKKLISDLQAQYQTMGQKINDWMQKKDNLVAGGKQEEYEIRLNELLAERQGKLKEILDTTKQIREGWVGAITAMTRGSGRITKIVMTQEKGTGLMLKHLEGVVQTSKSGAMRQAGEVGSVGFKEAGRYTIGGGIVGSRSGTPLNKYKPAYKTPFGAGGEEIFDAATKGSGSGTAGAARATAIMAQKAFAGIRGIFGSGGGGALGLSGSDKVGGMVTAKLRGRGAGGRASVGGSGSFGLPGGAGKFTVKLEINKGRGIDDLIDIAASVKAPRTQSASGK